jgi:hypothetical protein
MTPENTQTQGKSGGCTDATCSLTIDPTDTEVITICSMLCFQCGPIAARLRMAGHDINCQAEDEQGKVILWLLGMYKAHGKEWRAKTDEELRAMRIPANVKLSHEEGGKNL